MRHSLSRTLDGLWHRARGGAGNTRARLRCAPGELTPIDAIIFRYPDELRSPLCPACAGIIATLEAECAAGVHPYAREGRG